MTSRYLVALLLLSTGLGQAASPLVDRVDNTAFIQVEANSFNSLTPKQQALAYWLTQASIAIDPIIYDQQSRFGLQQKLFLETVLTGKAKMDPDVYAKILDYTKLFWANRGNHNSSTAQKFLPAFSPQELSHVLNVMGRTDLLAEASELRQSMYDSEFEPMMTAKSPKAGQDIIQGSSNNFYLGVTLADLKGFVENYPLNSRVVKKDGKLVEEVYRAGTPDGKVPAGLYSQYLKKANGYLAKAQAHAEPEQAAVIGDLIRYYQTGDAKDWLAFGSSWVKNNSPVDFVNGFIEVYRDARGAKATSQSFVSITNEKLTSAMTRLGENAQYFEDRAPWLAIYKKQGITPPIVKTIETIVETGDFHVTTIGDNLPNEDEIRQKAGSKSFLLTGSSDALEEVRGSAMNAEFAGSGEETARSQKYGSAARNLLTALHEVLGHGSGKLSEKLTMPPQAYLKEYFSALEEARADLTAYWNIFDPKLKELGLVESDDVGRAMYDSAARTMVLQLRSIPKGDTIEEDHMRGRQLIARYIMETTGAIAIEKRNNKTYVVVKDYDKMRVGVGKLLAELMRIKAEGDYAAIKKLMDQYGVHIDTSLRDEVVARYKGLNLPTYWAGINAELTAQLDPKGNVTKVSISYPRDYVKQQLGYSAMYAVGKK